MCKNRMFAQMCFAGCMVAVAAIVLFSAVEVKADPLLTDDFTVTDTSYPRNLNYNLAVRQAGSSLGTVTWYNQRNNNCEVGNTDYAIDSGNYLYTGGAGWGVAGLRHDFAVDANAADSPLTIEFDMSPVLGSSIGNWTALNVGTYSDPFQDFIHQDTELGLAFKLNGNVEVRAPGNVSHGETNLGSVLAPGEMAHFVVTISGQSGTGSGFSSNGVKVTASKDGGTVTTIWSSATGLTLGGLNWNGSAEGGVDNLSISVTDVP